MSVKEFQEEDLPVPRLPRRASQSILSWIPHLLLIITYCVVVLSWSKLRPHSRAGTCISESAPVANNHVAHWEARFMGTFSEIGDYFNVSTTHNPVPGALAAWQRVQEDQIKPVPRWKANYVRINRAIIASPAAGDSQALTHIHRLHCLHVLWRRWHDQISHDEKLAGIATEEHDGHCFEILRYALMCDSNLTIEKVGWTGTKNIREGWIDVAAYCEDPEQEGVELGDKGKTKESSPQ